MEEADRQKCGEPHHRGVEVSCCQVENLEIFGSETHSPNVISAWCQILGHSTHLLVCWDRSKSKPEGEDRHGDRGETSNDEERVTKLEELGGNGGLLEIGQDAASVEDSLRDVMHLQWGDITRTGLCINSKVSEILLTRRRKRATRVNEVT